MIASTSPVARKKRANHSGSDLRKGKLTLPVLYLLQIVNRKNIIVSAKYCCALARTTWTVWPWKLSGEARSVERSITTKRLVEEAQSEIQGLPVNKYSLAMGDIGDFLSNIVDQFAVAA